MKTIPPRTTLACRLARWRAALTGRRPAHAESCPICREHFAGQDSFDQELVRQSRVVANHPAPEGLETWIMAGVRNRPHGSRRPGARPSASSRAWLAAGACAVAAVLVAVSLLVRTPGPPVAHAPKLASDDTLRPEELAAVVASVDALPRKIGGAVAPSAVRMAESNPLLGEVNSLYADARSALGFLAMNFLPEETAGNLLNAVSDRQS